MSKTGNILFQWTDYWKFVWKIRSQISRRLSRWAGHNDKVGIRKLKSARSKAWHPSTISPGPLFIKQVDVAPQDPADLSKPRDSELDFSNRSDIWQAPRQQRCQCTCQIAERFNHYNTQPCDFETSRDLAVRRPSAWWPEAQLRGNSPATVLSRWFCILIGLSSEYCR